MMILEDDRVYSRSPVQIQSRDSHNHYLLWNRNVDNGFTYQNSSLSAFNNVSTFYSNFCSSIWKFLFVLYVKALVI